MPHRDPWKDPGPDDNVLNDLAPAAPLYRFVKVGRLEQLISDQRLVLVRPRLWEDPFEDFLSKTTVIRGGDRIGFGLTRDFVGQCWTLNAECDGMWRNYCGLDNGVRIQTTAAKLVRTIWDYSDRFADLRTFVGRVQYLDDDQIKSMLRGSVDYGHPITDPSGVGMVQTLLVKRREFAYEHEVRALACEPDQAKDHREFSIDPLGLIEGMMFSPKMEDAMYQTHRDWLIARGFPGAAISKSKLYEPWHLELDDP